jgi:aryl-alcohol dehydrogenase
MEALAAVLDAPQDRFRLRTVDIARPGPGQVLVRVQAAGICHTDLIFASGAMGSPFPLILGHEGAGLVEAVGPGVSHVAPGDKVLLTFDSCGGCPTCHSAIPAYCHSFMALNFACVDAEGGSPAHDPEGGRVAARFFGQSSFASLCIGSARNVVKLSADADLGVLAPLGCGVQTGVGGVLRSLKARAGSSLVVMGGGAVGLSAVLGGRIAECAAIVLIEPRPERRALGLELGATNAIDPAAEDTAAAVRAILPTGADYVFDTSGNVAALESAFAMLAPRGTLGMVGVPGSLDAVLRLPIVPAISAGFTVTGIIEGDSDPQSFLPELVALHAAGRLPVERFIRFYPFSQINEAIADAHAGRCVKAVLRID